MITGHQIREARRLVGMSTTTLAKKAKLRLPMIQKAEAYDGAAPIGAVNCDAIQGVLEAAGATFHSDDTVGVQPGAKTMAKTATQKAPKTPKAEAGIPATPPTKKNDALMKPMTLSKDLIAVVGKGPMPRTEVVSKMWGYIKEHNLQNPANKRNILADAKLKPIFGKDEVTMFEMTKLISAQLT